MATVLKSVIVPHSAATMFALVDDVERYPEFLPWCSGSAVLERTREITRARIEIGYLGLESRISTVNRKEEPQLMDLELVEGPFDEFRGRWRFVALGEEGCRVELALHYVLSSAALGTAMRPILGQILETIVDRFVARAEALA